MPPKPTTKPFKPQRPSGASTTTSKSTPSNKEPSRAPQNPTSTSRAKASHQQPSSTSHRSQRREPSASPSASDPEIEMLDNDADPFDDEEAPATIPPELLSRLLHEFISDTDGKLKISKSADRAVAKYMETFVREAVARAAFERAEAAKAGVGGGAIGVVDGFLEVEDLEKLAPQLVLDF